GVADGERDGELEIVQVGLLLLLHDLRARDRSLRGCLADRIRNLHAERPVRIRVPKRVAECARERPVGLREYRRWEAGAVRELRPGLAGGDVGRIEVD